MTTMWNLYWETYRKQVLTAYLHGPLDCQLFPERTEPTSTLKRLQRKPGGLCATDKTTVPPDHRATSPPQSPGSVPLWACFPVQCLMRPWPLFKKPIAALPGHSLSSVSCLAFFTQQVYQWYYLFICSFPFWCTHKKYTQWNVSSRVAGSLSFISVLPAPRAVCDTH